ncbi:hypothetical protein SAMN05428989_0076 [Pseudoxanthomonas sp. GM95]|uniref:hypothetical protein n=1 Tax=Pseudoxanthomonas sp. GM95 TaxID=1881043 RepID=UPI0008AC82A3|nr:hypothetical protein [Pseudoxanthomonas sp. GM95]SEK41581.1 hypothetical protein SAMN05428989_0076 [Pseudoxanthomonas sp. GM95]
MSRNLLVLLIAWLGCAMSAHAATVPSGATCKDEATVQARKLLVFHFGSDDDRIDISPNVEPLPSIVNPRNARQRFDVLEVWGTIYKGNYRMRFEYWPDKDGSCTLMGQEILEYASL